ncbi:unnamed protein product [Auanema sp. JU1783]|nr:unnamed protein product [Auanema sp. JU1783]
MARSRRDKDVSLTKVKKKTRATKENLVTEVRKAAEDYENVFVFTIENLRSTLFTDIRQKLKSTTRFFLGRNNVMSIALGRTARDECADGIHKVSEQLKGNCGLMFTNLSSAEVKKFFDDLKIADYARAGEVATQTVAFPQGPLEKMAFSMEPQLKKLGLPTQMVKGVIELTKDFEVCVADKPIGAESAKILKLFEIKMAFFQVKLKAFWSKKSGFKSL